MTNNDNIISPLQLFPHLWEIDETAHRRVEQIMTELLEKNPAPDKSTQQLAWVQHMSSLKTQAEEIVNAELIITILIIVIRILSFPIRNGAGMIRCNITNVEAAVCLYCRKFFVISYKSVIIKHKTPIKM